MNISFYIKRPKLESAIIARIRSELSMGFVDGVMPPGFGLGEGRVTYLDVSEVRVVESMEGRAPEAFQGVNFDSALLMIVLLSVAGVADGTFGTAPGSVPVPVRFELEVPYRLSLRQPLPEEVRRRGSRGTNAEESLLLESSRQESRGSVNVPGLRSLAWEQAFDRGRDPDWLSRVSASIQRVEVGSLLPPVSVDRLRRNSALAPLTRVLRPARIVGDEVQFGILPAILVGNAFIFPFYTAALRNFQRQSPRLSGRMDVAVEVGEEAATLAMIVLALGIATGIPQGISMGEPIEVAGNAINVVPNYNPFEPPPPNFTSLQRATLPLPLLTFGACQFGASFPLQSIRIDLSMSMTASRHSQPSRGERASPAEEIFIDVRVAAGFGQWDVDSCALALTAETLFGGAFWRAIMADQDRILEWRIVEKLTSNRLFGPQLDYWGARLEGTDSEGFGVVAGITDNFGYVGEFQVDPRTVERVGVGNSYRVSGAFEPFEQFLVETRGELLVRDQLPSFLLGFESGSPFNQASDCTQLAPSTIGFTLWNRSTRPVSIYQFEIQSLDWSRRVASQGLAWDPAPAPDAPIVIPVGGTVRVRLRFASADVQNAVLESNRSVGDFSELVVLVLSSRPPLVVRWNDPLRQLRAPTTDEVLAATEVCRRGPISSPWEIIRRPREFDLFPVFQPFWREDLSRVTPRDIQTKLPDNSLPWEGSSQLTVTEEARLDAGPGVFAILMQSASRRW